MASRLAHDIRTPLSVMRLSAQNLEQELEERYQNVPDELKYYFKTLTQEADRISEVTRSFLKFTRHAPPILEPTNLEELIRKTVEHRVQPAGVKIRFEIDGNLPQARVDAQQIVTLVENLLNNSYRAMKNGGELTVKLSLDHNLPKKAAKDGAIVLEITDTGEGIPSEDIGKVFDPYFSRSDGGTGLGLAIVKKIVEDHGGAIRINSIAGKGTSVIVNIPTNNLKVT